MKEIKKARDIAKRSLKACYLGKGILASCNHFSDYWARDSFWAIYGILAIGDNKKVRNILEMFLKQQRIDGKIPRKIILEYTFLKYVFKKKIKRKKPFLMYKGLIPPFHSMDENSLLIIAFYKYIQKNQDIEFANKFYKKLHKTISWYEKKEHNFLIREFFLSNWSDTIFRSGKTLYTNVLYCKALMDMGKIAKFLEKKEDEKIYFEKHKKTKDEINLRFWNGDFYNAQLGDQKHFDVIGNILAVNFDISSKKRTKKIVQKLNTIQKEIFLPTVCPKYSFWKINPLTYIMGISDYHNGTSWLWIDLMKVLLDYEKGNRKSVRKHLTEISEIIIRDGKIYETYYNDGRIYNKLFWKSAVPFAWNSGIFLYVFEEIFNKDNS